MKRLALSTLVVGLLLLAVARARAEEPTPADLQSAARAAGTVNGLCPVMGRPVRPGGGSATYRGEKIGFCCPGCVAKFDADPVRYMNAMRLDPTKHAYRSREPGLDDLKRAAHAAGSANGLCPVMGRPVTTDGGSLEYEGQKIAFCCKGCIERFRADPEPYMKQMRADPLAYAYDRPGPTHAELRAAREAVQSVNGLCPVMNRPVTARGGSVVYQGERIAFCCPGCVARFQASPDAYMAKMQAEPAVYGYVRVPGPSAAPRDGRQAGR